MSGLDIDGTLSAQFPTSSPEYIAHVAAVLRGQIDGAVRAEREAFLMSPGLSGAWISGWHSATDHIAAHLSDTERAGDAE